jgi:hypothetical protein
MAAADLSKALRVPGQLCYVATTGFTFTDPFPHGGTALGMTLGAEVRHRETVGPIRDESLGMEIVDLVESGEEFVLAFSLRGSDADALGAVFRNTITGAVSGEPVVVWPGARREGVLRSVNRQIALLFSPTDPEQPAVYLPAAIPMLAEERKLVLHRKEERLILAGFLATRASAANASGIQIGLLEDLVEPS